MCLSLDGEYMFFQIKMFESSMGFKFTATDYCRLQRYRIVTICRGILLNKMVRA